MSNIGFATPGVGTGYTSQANQFIWGGPKAEVIEMGYQIDPAARDAGSSITTILRPGLAMGKVTATGLLKQLDVTAVDGTANFVGFIKEECPLIDSMGRALALGALVPLIIKAPVKAKKILYLGVTMIGHANEAAVRSRLRPRFLLDDEEASTAYAALNVFSQRTRVTLAQVNAGYSFVPAVVGQKYRMIDCAMIAIGGAVTGSTTIDVLATQGAASVKLVANAVAGLTQSAVLRAGDTNSAVLADGASFLQNDVNTAITISKTGAAMATATHVDVIMTYELAP